MVQGLWPTLLIGLAGGMIAELIRIAEVLRANRGPTPRETLASVIMAFLGSGAVLYGYDAPQAALKVATLGAAFPLLFSAAVRDTTTPSRPQRRTRSASRDGQPGHGRTLSDYLAGRFLL
jgi:hypothetical protein